MASTDTVYSARFEGVDLLEQGRDNVLQLRLYRDGAVVAPTEAGSTAVVYNASNASIGTTAVSVDGATSFAELTVTQAMLDANVLGEGWRVEWDVVVAGVAGRRFDNRVAYVRRRLQPMVTELDLYRRMSVLDPNGTAPITNASDFQGKLDEVLLHLEDRLIKRGRRPWLIVDRSALREPFLECWLWFIFRDLGMRRTEYREIARDLERSFEAAWSRCTFEYAPADDGIPEPGRRRSAERGVVWMNNRS